MDNSVYEYKKRRQNRLNERLGVRMDAVELYKVRRLERMQARFDRGMGWVYRALKDKGVDPTGWDLGKALDEWNKINGGEGKFPVQGRLSGKHKKKAKEEAQKSNGSKNYISAKDASEAKEIGGYKRKNTGNFKNGYGNTIYDDKDVAKPNPESKKTDNGKTVRENTNENHEWTEEREALHSRIIDDFFDGAKKADGKPVTVFMGGGPASGKTYVKDAFGAEFGIPDGCVLADPDACKKGKDPKHGIKGLPEYDEDAPWFVHEESSSLAKRITKLSQENGYNTLVDGTGDGTVEKMRKKIQQAKDAGNEVRGRYVFMPVEDAIQLNHKRDRSIAVQELIDTHKKITKILPEIAPDFDDVELYANVIGGKPKLIAKGGGGKPLDILDKDLYQRFLSNGDYECDMKRVRELESTELARKKTKRYAVKS